MTMRLPVRSRAQPSALEAYRRVLRYIHQTKAGPGARLPPQGQLVRKLKVCAETLDAAMKLLVADGVVKRRQKAGTFVQSPYPLRPMRTIWNVASVMSPITRSYFGAVAGHYINKHASLQGIASRSYMLSPFAAHGAEVDQRAASDFTGLQEDLSENLLDAIITTTRLVCPKVPVCSAAAWKSATFGVFINHEHFVRGAIDVLLDHGCRRLHYVSPFDERTDPALKAFIEMAGVDVRKSGIGFENVRCNGASSSDYAERMLVRELLARHERARPDGLIVQDDITAQIISTLLANTNYRPAFVVETNRQIPLSFAIPSISFAVDLEEMARLAVEILVNKLLSPRSPGILRTIEATRMPLVTPSMINWRPVRPAEFP